MIKNSRTPQSFRQLRLVLMDSMRYTVYGVRCTVHGIRYLRYYSVTCLGLESLQHYITLTHSRCMQ